MDKAIYEGMKRDMEKAEEALVEQRRLVVLLLRNIADRARCRGCNADIYWVVHKNGKKVPYTPIGLNHFADCPQAGKFRK